MKTKTLFEGKWFRIGVAALIIAVTLAGYGLQLQVTQSGEVLKSQPSAFTIGDKVVCLTLGTVEAAGTIDYLIDGIADDIEWQEALDALPATGGVLQMVSSGTLNFTATVSRAINNVTFVGAGTGSYFTNNGVMPLFSTGAQTGWVFKDLKTDAGGITQSVGTMLVNVTLGATYYGMQTSNITSSSLTAPTGRSSTYVIAASDATALEKSQADLVLNGTTDAVTINTAISGLAQGATVVFSSTGTIILELPVYPTDYMTLRGGNFKVKDKVTQNLTENATATQFTVTVADTTGFLAGMDVTIFDNAHQGYNGGESNHIVSVTPATGVIQLSHALLYSYQTTQTARIFSAYNAIQLSDLTATTGGKIHVTIDGLIIDGNKANQLAGNYDEFQNGIYLNNSHYAVVKNNYVHDVIYGGVLSSHYTDGAYDGTEQAQIINNQLYANNYNAIHLHGMKHSNISGNSCSAGGQAIIYDAVGSNNTFSSNTLDTGTGYGYCLLGTDKSSISGGTIISTTNIGIIIANLSADNALDNVINGVTISTTGKEGIRLNSGAIGTSVTGNTITGTAEDGIFIVGAYTNVTGNNFYGISGNYGISLNASSYCTVIGNTIYKTAYGDGLYIATTNSVISGNVINCTNVATGNMVTSGAMNTNIITNNKGWIYKGEIRTISATITGTASDNGAIMLSVDNPFGQAVQVTNVRVEITVNASAAATIDCGIGSSATADYTTMIAALPINPGTTYPYYYDAVRTSTYGKMAAVSGINWATGSGNRYLNFFNPSANASGTVFRATYTVTVMGD